MNRIATIQHAAWVLVAEVDSTHAADWKPLAGTGRTKVYLDAQSVVGERCARRAWFRQNISPPLTTSGGPVDSIALRMQFDCDARTFRTEERRIFSGKGQQRRQTGSFPNAPDHPFVAVQPNTLTYRYLGAACAR